MIGLPEENAWILPNRKIEVRKNNRDHAVFENGLNKASAATPERTESRCDPGLRFAEARYLACLTDTLYDTRPPFMPLSRSRDCALGDEMWRLPISESERASR